MPPYKKLEKMIQVKSEKLIAPLIVVVGGGGNPVPLLCI